MNVLEIQASLLEVETDKEGKAKHTKHVAVVISDPALCADIANAVEEALAKEQKLHGVKPEDALTLENCEDASAFSLTGKGPSDEEKKANEKIKATKFSVNKKKKAKDADAA